MTLLFKCLRCHNTWHDAKVCPHCGCIQVKLLQKLYCFLKVCSFSCDSRVN